jgi:hypothetical protein
MPKFEFETSITAPTKEEAIRKMKSLTALGSKLSSNELQVLENTVNSPTALALAKQKLGL